MCWSCTSVNKSCNTLWGWSHSCSWFIHPLHLARLDSLQLWWRLRGGGGFAANFVGELHWLIAWAVAICLLHWRNRTCYWRVDLLICGLFQVEGRRELTDTWNSQFHTNLLDLWTCVAVSSTRLPRKFVSAEFPKGVFWGHFVSCKWVLLASLACTTMGCVW